MSSILKALKRLESETSKEHVFPAGKGTIPAKDAVNKRVRRTWFFNRFFLIFFVPFAFVAFAGWFFFGQRPIVTVQPLTDSMLFKEGLAKKEDKTAWFPREKTQTFLKGHATFLPEKKRAKEKSFHRKTPQVKDIAPSDPLTHIEMETIVKELKDSRLQLQAIAWSQNPEERMAVINGIILREGESIEGFSVSHIGSEAVVLRDGEEAWNLIFKIK